MAFLDETLELKTIGTNLTQSQESFESQSSGPCQTPSFSSVLLPAIKEEDNNGLLPGVTEGNNLLPGVIKQEGNDTLLPSQETQPQQSPSQPSTSPLPLSTTTDQTKPFTIEITIEEMPHKRKRKYDRDIGEYWFNLKQDNTEVVDSPRIKKEKTVWDSAEYLFMSYAKSFKQLSLRKQVKIKMALEELFGDAKGDESVNKSMNLSRELDSDEDRYFADFNMSRESFEELHYIVRPYIQKMDTNYRKAIGSRARLAVFLRYITTGESFVTLSNSFCMGRSTVSMIVDAVSKAIWECLQPKYMPTPTEDIWKQSEAGYQEIWNFPNCVGSVGGKHVMIQCPRNSGNESIVLFGIADPFNKFTVIDVGSYGHPSDSNTFECSAFYNQQLYDKKLLPPKPLPGSDEAVPHVLIGDEVFALQTFLMRPFPPATSMHDPRKQRFNTRLAHARSVVENTFGILAETWRVFQKPLECNVEKAVNVTKAACCLHNYVTSKHSDIIRTISNETILCENTGKKSKKLGNNAFTSLRPTNIRSPNAALEVREKFVEYFSRDINHELITTQTIDQ